LESFIIATVVENDFSFNPFVVNVAKYPSLSYPTQVFGRHIFTLA
jgi:hypothetical protein